jgi:mRNA turnover protein 4
MRNAHLKTVRNLWKEYALFIYYQAQNGLRFAVSSARIFFGRGAVMAKALGTTPEEEHRLGLSKLATVRKQNPFLLNHALTRELANKRPSRALIHGYRTPRSHRLVC